MAITISTEDINQIKSALGYPSMCVLDWGSASADDDYIETYVVPRVLRIYSTYFPQLQDNDYSVSGNFEIPYPTSSLVFKAFQWFFNYKTEFGGQFTNPWVLQNQLLHRGTNFYSDLLGPGNVSELFSREATAESLTDYHKVHQIFDYPNLRKLKGFSSVASNLYVRWATAVENFDLIDYRYKDDALKLAKAYLMQDAYRKRELLSVQSSKITINSSPLAEQATAWETEVIEGWKTRGFPVIVAS